MKRRRRILYWLGFLLAVVGALRAAAAGEVFEPPGDPSPEPSPTVAASPAQRDPPAVPSGPRPAGVPAEAQEGTVARIVDGDTIWVAIDRPGGPIPAGNDHRVRMLEIDTPETVRPNAAIQCGGLDASAFARAELPVGSAVYLVADREDKDRYGRYLRYVWDFEGEFYNEKAVAEGYAKAVLYRPNDRYISRMREVEAAARLDGRGLWGACGAQ